MCTDDQSLKNKTNRCPSWHDPAGVPNDTSERNDVFRRAILLACAFPLSVAWFFFWRMAGGCSGDVVVVLLAATILPHLLAWILNRSEHDFRVVFAIGSSSLMLAFALAIEVFQRHSASATPNIGARS
jgi:hypothetical protein